MKITLENLYNGQPVFSKIAHQEMPVGVALKVMRLVATLEREHGSAEEVRNKLVEKYGRVREDGQFEVKRENIQMFQEELNKLFVEELTIDHEKIPLNDLGEIKLTPAELFAMQPFVIIEE